MQIQTDSFETLKQGLINKKHEKTNQNQGEQNIKYFRKLSFAENYKRRSFYSKQRSQIPSLKQAKQRQKQIKFFHKRNFYKKQKHLEDLFKQNCRIYQQLNNQRSRYSLSRKGSKAHSVSCIDYSMQKKKSSQKMSRGESSDFGNLMPSRKCSLNSCKNKQKINMTYYMNCMRNNYEKSKTQMGHARICLKNKQNVISYDSFTEKKKHEQSFKNEIEDNSQIKIKKRPKTGVRF